MAHAGLVAAGAANPIPGLPVDDGVGPPGRRPTSLDTAIVQGAQLAVAGVHTEAARVVDEALTGAEAGDAGWLLPIEPLLNVTAHSAIWARTLARLRNRAA
jgi:hypothetical protein